MIFFRVFTSIIFESKRAWPYFIFFTVSFRMEYERNLETYVKKNVKETVNNVKVRCTIYARYP